VALEPGVPCCNNIYTREGRYNLDPDIKMFATPPNHGALAQVGTCLSMQHAASWQLCIHLRQAVLLDCHGCRQRSVEIPDELTWSTPTDTN
jgi:hypothetical protein